MLNIRVDIVTISLAGKKEILQWTWSTIYNSKLPFRRQMVKEIISHFMPSVEDSLNITLPRNVILSSCSVIVITDYELPPEQRHGVWRKVTSKLAVIQTHTLILTLVDLLQVIPLCYIVRVIIK